MVEHFLPAFAKSLRTDKASSLINALSLAVGLAVFAIAYVYVERALSHDSSWPNAERIHRLVLEQRGIPGAPDGSFTGVNPRAFAALLDYFPEQIEAASRMASTRVQTDGTGSGFINLLSLVDPAFVDIFSFHVMDGSLAWVLENPGLIALSEAKAAALGDGGRVGQRLRLKTYLGGEQEFEVGAIIRPPARTTLQVDMLVAIGTHAAALFPPSQIPWEGSTNLWLLLKPGERTEDFNAQMPPFVERSLAAFNDALPAGSSISEHLFYRVQPLREMHLNPVGFEDDGLIFGDKSKVWTFAAVGVLVLLVSCSNSASLSLANVLRRRREIGIRKTCGADKRAIALHYLGESVLLALAALGLALALRELLAPVLSLLNLGDEFSLRLTDSVLLLVIAVLIGLINGAYPAFVLSGARPRAVLRSGPGLGLRRSQRARALLVAGQFSLAVMFLAGALSLYVQLAVARAQALGYDHRDLLWFNRQSAAAVPAEVTVNTLLGVPGVSAAVAMVTVPPNMNLPLTVNSFKLVSEQGGGSEVQTTQLMVAEGFLEMLRVPLLAGRSLDASRDATANDQNLSAPTIEHVLINRRAAEALGFDSPAAALNQLIYKRRGDTAGQLFDLPLRVVGVVEDNLYSSVHRRPVPEFYSLPPERYSEASHFMLRYEPAVAAAIQQRVARALEPLGAQWNFEFIEGRIDAAFIQERNESRVLLAAAGLALFLSCIGLYGLTRAIVARSVKEVGVRKVLGAGVGSVVGLFLWRFSRPLLLANLVAWPVAGWFVLRWIQRFPYQIDLLWLVPLFLGASLLVLLVAWLTVSGVTLRAALGKPVRSLRYE